MVCLVGLRVGLVRAVVWGGVLVLGIFMGAAGSAQTAVSAPAAPKQTIAEKIAASKGLLDINAATAEQMRAAKENLGATIIEVSPQHLTSENVAACHALGMKLMAYEPEKNEATFRKLIELGADMVNLNHADVFQKVEQSLVGAKP